MGKVLVLGRDSRAFLAVIRSLGRGGLEVHAAWPGIDTATLRSRYLHSVHETPPYLEHDPAWVASFAELLGRERFDLVIPCSDTTVAALQLHRRELEPFGRLCVIDDRSYRLLSDKGLSTEAARSAGVPVPREVLVRTSAEPPPAFGWPLVLKPRTSYDAVNPSARRAVRKVYRESDYAPMLAEALRGGPVLVQENVPGRGAGVELLLHKGEPLLAFQHLRVHEPLMGGGSSYRKSVPVSAELLESSLSVLRPLAYTGVAMIEFKVDEPSGRYVFLEVNARFWGSLPLALVAGVDFPLALYRLLVDGRIPARARYRSPIFCRNLTLDLAWQIANLRADRSDPTLATRPLGAVVRDAMVNTLTLREHVDTLAIDDPAPAIEEVRQIVRHVGGRLSRGRTTFVRTRSWMRRRRAARAMRAAHGATSLLFVCKGNVCRSPFAEAIAKKSGAFQLVASAGYFPADGRRSPENAIRAAAEFDIDLQKHRSRRLSTAHVRAADAIFVFDEENFERVVADFPEARGRVHWLGTLNPSGPMFIDDPWSGDIGEFRRTYAQIAAAVRAMEDGKMAPNRVA